MAPHNPKNAPSPPRTTQRQSDPQQLGSASIPAKLVPLEWRFLARGGGSLQLPLDGPSLHAFLSGAPSEEARRMVGGLFPFAFFARNHRMWALGTRTEEGRRRRSDNSLWGQSAAVRRPIPIRRGSGAPTDCAPASAAVTLSAALPPLVHPVSRGPAPPSAPRPRAGLHGWQHRPPRQPGDAGPHDTLQVGKARALRRPGAAVRHMAAPEAVGFASIKDASWVPTLCAGRLCWQLNM
jgi:hypothetical protein